MILDCESAISTRQSLSRLFNCSENNLIKLLGGIDIGGIYRADPSPDISQKWYLLQKVVDEFGVNATPSGVCWFHGTRTINGNKFKDGILPLGLALSGIWETILGIFEDSEHYGSLIELREGGVPNFHYQTKTKDTRSWGPHAVLVRDVAFCAKAPWTHDYLRLPEIIEDICNGYMDRFGISIHDDVVNSLRPCIVKFKSNYKIRDGFIAAALFYLYLCTHDKGLWDEANDCFDAENQTIPPEDILNIEFIDMTEQVA